MLTAALLLAATATATTGPAARIDWQPWSEAAFARAKAEHRLVVLDLEAVWCHWCHVMDEVTYHDPKVVKLLRDHAVALRVDQDSRPDLASRYEAYGWPATIVFASDGRELAKRSGYLPPVTMASMLEAFVANQSPGPSVEPEPTLAYATTPLLPPALRQTLEASHKGLYDQEQGGWGRQDKYVEWNSVEYAMSRHGDAEETRRARTTLELARGLVDPVWGGVYQYSAEGDWKHPHFEKIMQFQAETMRMDALAYLRWHDPKDLASAKAIERFVADFLTSPEGGFYTSMDADLKPGEHSAGYFALDDAGRRRLGVPRVDQHRYARENGWMIQGLLELTAATGDPGALAAARKALAWVQANRALPGGGFRHGDDAAESGGPFLGDTLSMARALLRLYLVTGERPALAASEAAAGFLVRTFPNPAGPGLVTAKAATGDARPPTPNRDEMIALARYATLLAQVTGDPAHRALAESALRFLVTPGVAGRLPTGGVLLAVDELQGEPVHVTVVGPKGDERARALFAAALRYPDPYKRVEWWDRAEGPLRRADVTYPEMRAPAAFACNGTRCSVPLTKPEELVERVKTLASPPPGH